VNDIGNSYYTGSTESATLTAILKSYFGQMQILYNAGARYFVFLTVPPIQKTPLMLAEAASSQTLEAQTIATFNSELASSAASFASANSGTKYWVYDTQVPFNTAINNPTAYGAADATCYNSDGVTCLWWNNYHPGQAIQTLVAKGVAAALKGTFF
jgi:phospholipase/lecithinase/hemolysin